MIPVFLCKNLERPPGPYISLSPRDTRWNDFSRNYHADLDIKFPDSEEVFSCRAMVMPLDWADLEATYRFDDWANTLISQGESYTCLSETMTPEGKPRFITLLNGETSYRTLAIRTDQDSRIGLLKAFNDLVFLTHAGILSTSDKKSILDTENFRLGVMCRGSAFQALHRGERHIWGKGKPLLEDARVPFIFNCMLRGFNEYSHTLSIEYVNSPLLEDRIHCLIGKNGCGKTRLLRELLLELASNAEPFENCFLDNFESTVKESPEYDGPNFRRVLCFALDSHAQFPPGTRTDALFEYIYTNLSGRGDIGADQSSTSTGNLTRLLVDILRSDEALVEDWDRYVGTRYSLLIKALSPYIDLATVFIPLLDDAPTTAEYLDNNGKKWISVARVTRINEKAALLYYSYVDFDRDIVFTTEGRERFDLSSGHSVFFKFVVSFLSYIDVGTLVILDEPETHLHPNLVCDFMNLMYEVLAATKSVALVATHSAYVVREVPTHCAHVYTVDEEGRPSENFVYLRTLGANIENISQAVFADSNAKKFHRRIAEEMANGNRDFDKVIVDYSEIMSPELLSQVARLIDSQAK